MKPQPPEDDDLQLSEIHSDDSTVELEYNEPPAVLAESQPFMSLSKEIQSLIHTNMIEHRFERGEFLMKQGDPGTFLLVVVSGQAEVSVEENGERYVLKRADAGEVLGEMALLTKEPRTASVLALTPVEALLLSADRFDELATRHPKISSLLTLLLASRLGRLQHDAMTGNTFHGYRIRRCLGRGGMSVVYEADEPGVDRRVALKMMSHRLLYDPVASLRFKREAEIVESFDHPNIARTYGRFEAFRTSFMVMELCEGISIAKAVLGHGRLPEDLARKVLGQVACAVAHAHEAGIVHRDIKPSNIMATRDGTVKLIDFGLAHQIDIEPVTPLLFGTPRYMAPEQMRSGAVGKQADLFAMGHVAYEMLSGERLFKSKDFRALRNEVIKCRIPDLSESLPTITPELRTVIADLLRRDPAERRIDFDQVRSWAAPVPLDAFEPPGPA